MWWSQGIRTDWKSQSAKPESCWFSDSKRLCFKGIKPDASEEIASISIEPKKPNLKVHYAGKNVATDFAWHPDGERIVCCLYCPERGVSQLYEFNPNSNDPPQLLKGQNPKTANTAACWTPDGKRLIVISGND